MFYFKDGKKKQDRHNQPSVFSIKTRNNLVLLKVRLRDGEAFIMTVKFDCS